MSTVVANKEKVYRLPELINYYEVCNRTEGKSPKTISWYSSNLRRFHRYLKSRHLPDSVEYIDIKLLREYILYLLKRTRYIAPQDPQGAADELVRAVTKLGLRGASINSHTRGEYLDNKKFWHIFEQAEKLNVPIYIHPRTPSPDMLKPYLDYPGLDTAMLGFAHEVALHALRLICSGLFDEYPKLQIILGHLGESLPYWLWRIDDRAAYLSNKLQKKPSQYIKDNFYITTSGMFWQPALMCAYLALGAERILFAVDYPLQELKDAVQFMEEAPICDYDKEKICYLNAQQLLGL